MTLDNKISVIVPVYNAGEFVIKAVESALIQSEVFEIILIEDGSTDTSLKVCKGLAGKYDKVKLNTHEGNANKGAGFSRNLGIQKASGDYVSFLDADDFFLPERFKAERKIFTEKPEIDGVYGALGFYYYSEEGKIKFKEKGFTELTTVSGRVPPAELLLVLLWLHQNVKGYFSLDALTLRRNVFCKTEMFNHLKMHEDSVFIIQLSLNCKLEAAIIEKPIAMRGVHDNNRIVNEPTRSDSNIIKWNYLYNWAKSTSKPKELIKFFQHLLMKEKISYLKPFQARLLFIWYTVSHRGFVSGNIFFTPNCIHAFGKKYAWYIINFKRWILNDILKNNPTITDVRFGLTKALEKKFTKQ